MNEKEYKYDVFISYSSRDQIIADGVLNYLEKNKIRCFIAYRDIPKGLDWAKFIPGALRGSRMMLVIFSKNFNDSEQTDNEISIAAKRHIPMLVFRITDDDFNGSKEYHLTKSNWIEAFPEPEKLFGDLHRNICYLLGIKDGAGQVQRTESIVTATSEAPGDDLIRKGLTMFYSEDGDKEMAVYYFRKAAKMGNATGEYMVGEAYFLGCGMENSWEDAFRHYSIAASKGNTNAMTQLARMHRYGIGREHNTMKAMELYIKAANGGNGIAMKELGKVFRTGELGVIDEERSREYYEQAFDTLYDRALGDNDPVAQQALGNSYMDGEGVKKSYSQAVKMFQRAAKNNYPPSFNTLSICYSEGWGVEKDMQKAFELQLKGARMGLPIAMSNTSKNYCFGDGVEKDEKKYKEWRDRAAECGNITAQTSVGIDYYTGEIEEKNLDKAKKWLEKAIASGAFDARVLLGSMYENDEIEDPNGMGKAFELYKQAAIGGNVWAMRCLATCYFDGNGTEQDYGKAAYWYEKVAEIYENMVANDEDTYISQNGAGIYTTCLFNQQDTELFAECFANLAEIYRNGDGGIEADSLKADKWKKVSQMLRGEIENVEQSNDTKELENAAKKGNADALDRLLSIYEGSGNKEKIRQWANYAIENKMAVSKRDLMTGVDHVELVLTSNDIEDHKKITDYLKLLFKSAKDGGNYMNCYSLYNALCREHKQGNIALTEEERFFIREDANKLVEDIYFPGYLRKRQEHFDILFPDYAPEKIINGDFSNPRDFILFYAEHTTNKADLCISNIGLEKMVEPLRDDISYNAVVRAQNGHTVNCGEAGRAINDFKTAYDKICKANPAISKVHIDDYSFDMLVPIAMPEQMLRWSQQMLKALISVRSMFGNKWSNVVSKLTDHDALLDIAEVEQNEDLQLMLVAYVEYFFDYEGFCIYAKRLMLIHLDKNYQALADELNAYARRLENNNIAHNLPQFTIDNIPQDVFADDDNNDEDQASSCENGGEDEEALQDLSESKPEQELSADEMYTIGNHYFEGTHGKPQDFTKAAEWFRKAGEKGHAAALNDYGYCLYCGKGVEKNTDEAFRMYMMAAEKGDAVAQSNVGSMYLYGTGCQRDYDKAVEWLRKSVAQNNARAMFLLGGCYYFGEGVPVDIGMAKQLFRQSADLGYEHAKEKLKELEAADREKFHIVEENGLYGFADGNNQQVLECQWSKVKDFKDDVALVWEGKKMGAINAKGNYYFSCNVKCKDASYLGHGVIKVFDDPLYYVYDLNGESDGTSFDSMGDAFENGYVKAVKYRIFGKNKSGKIDTKGNFIEDA